jgi:hypothetical protein
MSPQFPHLVSCQREHPAGRRVPPTTRQRGRSRVIHRSTGIAPWALDGYLRRQLAVNSADYSHGGMASTARSGARRRWHPFSRRRDLRYAVSTPT